MIRLLFIAYSIHYIAAGQPAIGSAIITGVMLVTVAEWLVRPMRVAEVVARHAPPEDWQRCGMSNHEDLPEGF